MYDLCTYVCTNGKSIHTFIRNKERFLEGTLLRTFILFFSHFIITNVAIYKDLHSYEMIDY